MAAIKSRAAVVRDRFKALNKELETRIADLEASAEFLKARVAKGQQLLEEEERRRRAAEKEVVDLKDRLKRAHHRLGQALDAAGEGSTAAGINARVTIRLMQHIDGLEKIIARQVR